MEIYFVLVKPALPENVGAAARAIKTMGFRALRVVASDAHLSKAARILAHGADDILAGVEAFASLEDALRDMDLVVGSSAKRRLGKRFNYPVSELKHCLQQKVGSLARVALVFGCEESGLSNRELDCCDMLTSIPIAQPYPSLNLAQAVMVYAYSLSELAALSNVEGEAPVDDAQWQVLKQRVQALLADHAIAESSKLGRWALERLTRLDKTDVDFMHLLLKKLQ